MDTKKSDIDVLLDDIVKKVEESQKNTDSEKDSALIQKKYDTLDLISEILKKPKTPESSNTSENEKKAYEKQEKARLEDYRKVIRDIDNMTAKEIDDFEKSVTNHQEVNGTNKEGKVLAYQKETVDIADKQRYKEETQAKYRELKQNRDHYIKTFTLNGVIQTEQASEEEIEEPRNKIRGYRKLYEYTNVSQREEISKKLKSKREKYVVKSFITLVLLAISIVVLFFSKNYFRGIYENYQLLKMINYPLNAIVINGAVTIITLLLSGKYIKQTLCSLFKGKFDSHSGLLLAFICNIAFLVVSYIDVSAMENIGSLTLTELEINMYTPILILCVFVKDCGEVLKLKRVAKNFNILYSNKNYTSILPMENKVLERKIVTEINEKNLTIATKVKTPFLEGFMEESLGEDLTDKVSRILTPIMLLIAIIVAGANYILWENLHNAVNILAAISILACCPANAYLVQSPIIRASKYLNKSNVVLSSYKGVERIAKTKTILFNSSDLFKKEDVELLGIRTFSHATIDKAILDATSVLFETQSVLSDIFKKIISNNVQYLDKVDNIDYQENQGISAKVSGREVLIGSRELMVQHHIDIAEHSNTVLNTTSSEVFLAVDGILNAIFTIQIKSNKDIRDLLVDLYNENYVLLVKTVDCMLTKETLSNIFHLPIDAFQIVSTKYNNQIIAESKSEKPKSAGLFMQGDNNTHGFFKTVLMCKNLQRNMIATNILQMALIFLGVGVSIVLTAFHGFSQLTTEMFLVYQIVCIILCRFFSYIKRV